MKEFVSGWFTPDNHILFELELRRLIEENPECFITLDKVTDSDFYSHVFKTSGIERYRPIMKDGKEVLSRAYKYRMLAHELSIVDRGELDTIDAFVLRHCKKQTFYFIIGMNDIDVPYCEVHTHRPDNYECITVHMLLEDLIHNKDKLGEVGLHNLHATCPF